MEKPRIYIAGPITGHDLAERWSAFKAYEYYFLDNGYEVINPMELPHDHDKIWGSYMRECIPALCKCDYIFLMKDWYTSEGARIEFDIAMKLGIKPITQDFKQIK